MKRAASVLWSNIGFVCVALMLVYCVVHAFDPPRLNWGDSGSDYNVMTAGRNFQKYGFLKMRLTPHLLDAALLNPNDPSKVYTHYPQLPDLMNGVLRTVFRLSDLVQFRFVALGFSFAALFFIYRLLQAYWSRRTAQIALALWVINPLWIQHADHLHAVPYGAFFGYGSVYFLTRYLADERRRGFLIAAGGFLFFVFLSSYDYWFFAPLLLAIVAVTHYRGVRAPAVRVLSVLAIFAAAAISFKLATNAWVLGGVGALVQDLKFQLVERTANPVSRVPIAPGIWPTLVGRVERCFSLLLFPIAIYWAAVAFFPRTWESRGPLLQRAKANPWILLLAALPFLSVFVELWVGQYYPTLLVMPFYAVASAALAGRLLDTSHRWAAPLACVLVAALFTNSVAEDVAFKKAFIPRAEVAEMRARLDSVSAPGQYVMTNQVIDFFYAYYFDRPTIDLILTQPEQMAAAVVYYSNPKRPRVAPPSGAIFVQHKHLPDQLFDKGFYFLLARDGLWDAWANPERHHAAIDAFVAQRDSLVLAAVTPTGVKLYETDDYVIWRIPPPQL
jgi:hypothetical protein